jgi:DNA polymerase III sliding clamp (beta) subunit (PCNA family)
MILSKKECLSISKILPVAPEISVIPILSSAKIATDGDNGVFFQVGNFQCLASYVVGSGEIPELFIDAKQLFRAFKSPIGENYTLSSAFNRLVIKGDYSSVKLNSAHESVDWPTYDIGVQKKVYEIESQEFSDKMNSAIWFASKDELRPSMTNVLLEGNGVLCFIVSTDAHKLYFDTFKNACANDFKILIPHKLCRIISSCIKSYKGNVQIHLSEENKYHRISFGKYTFDFRVSYDKYPNWRAVLKDEVFSVFASKSELKNAFFVANSFSSEYTKRCKINCKKGDSNITISTRDEDYDCDSEVKVCLSKPSENDIKTFVNSKFFLEILKKVNPKDDVCKISITGNSMSALIIDNKILLMPLNDFE